MLPILVVVGLILWPLSAQAGAPTDQLRASIDKVTTLLEDPAPTKGGERRGAIRKVVHKTFDFAECAKRSLAGHWHARTDKERKEFTKLFGDLLDRWYLLIERYKGERIVYTGETIDGDQATVRTKIITRQGAEFYVDYRLLRRGDRWHVYDVTFEGVSLVASYRAQFNRIIRTSSYQELVKRLKAKQEEFTARDQVPGRWIARLLAILSLLGHDRRARAAGGAGVPTPSSPSEVVSTKGTSAGANVVGVRP
ncbi:MAG: ABC transporter substrate-binding protein [Candidatus Rokubacteria bacterium]|nr:ABC transporter substrate-binding protein [Candidatus Rokubacteria bacterium]